MQTGAVQRRTLQLLAFAQIFTGIGVGAVVSTGSLIAVDLSGSEAWAGSVTTTMTLGAAFASAYLLRIAVEHGRRKSLATGLFLAAIGAVTVIIAAVTKFFPILLLAGLLLGFGNAVNLQARFAATDLSAPHRRSRDLSIIMWMSTIGSVAGPNLIATGETVAAIVNVPPLSGIFVIFAAAVFIGALLIWLGLRPDPYLVRLAQEGASPDTKRERPSVKTGLQSLWRYAGARIGFVHIISAHAVMVGVMSMTPVHMVAHGAAVTLVGLTVSLHIAGMYALSPLMGWLTDRFGGQRVALGGQITLLVSGVLAAFSGDAHNVTIVALILLGLGWSAATVAGSSLIVKYVPASEAVGAQGASDTFMSLAGALGGLLAGIILGAIGYFGLGLISAAVSLVVTVRYVPHLLTRKA